MKTISILSTAGLTSITALNDLPNFIEIDSTELIRTDDCLDSNQITLLNKLIHQKIVAVFTSMNAVAAVGKIKNATTAEWKIYCIGTKTVEYVKKYFPSANLQGTAQNAEALGELIVREAIAEKIYFFCGDIRREDLPRVIGDSTIELKEMIVYKTTLISKKIVKKYDGILFYSPSGVESFFSANDLGSEVILFAIGKTTAEAVAKHCNNKIVVGQLTSKLALLNASIQYFKNEAV